MEETTETTEELTEAQKFLVNIGMSIAHAVFTETITDDQGVAMVDMARDIIGNDDAEYVVTGAAMYIERRKREFVTELLGEMLRNPNVQIIEL